jgi:hypothetical protein
VPPTAADLVGVWNRESDEHGSEFIRFGDDASFAYADGRVENLETAEIAGSYVAEAGSLVVETSDCPGVPGSYALRVYAIGVASYLTFTVTEDACSGRSDGLTFGPWARLEG